MMKIVKYLMVFSALNCSILYAQDTEKDNERYRVIESFPHNMRTSAMHYYTLVERNDTLYWILSETPCDEKFYKKITKGDEYELRMRKVGKFHVEKLWKEQENAMLDYERESIVKNILNRYNADTTYVIDDNLWETENFCAYYVRDSVLDSIDVRMPYAERLTIDIYYVCPPDTVTQKWKKNEFCLRAVGGITERPAGNLDKYYDSIIMKDIVMYLRSVLILQHEDKLYLVVPNMVKHKTWKKMKVGKRFTLKLQHRRSNAFPRFDYKISDLIVPQEHEVCDDTLYDIFYLWGKRADEKLRVYTIIRHKTADVIPCAPYPEEEEWNVHYILYPTNMIYFDW